MKKLLFVVALIGVLVGSTLAGIAIAQPPAENQDTGLAEISSHNMPASASPGMVQFTVGVKNTGDATALCYAGPHGVEGTADMTVSGALDLAPGELGYFVFSFTMGQVPVTLELRSWHHEGVGYDDHLPALIESSD